MKTRSCTSSRPASPAGAIRAVRLIDGPGLASKPIGARRHWPCRLAGVVLLALVSLALTGQALGAAVQPEPGLAVTFTSAGVAQPARTIAPNVWLYVEATNSPSPFLPAGPFTAVWAGLLSAELRGNFFFQTEVSGAFQLEINGSVVLDFAGTNAISPFSKSIQLNKGANAFKATFISPAQGDAMVRLSWTEKTPYTSPISLAALSHLPRPEWDEAARLLAGRELFLEHRCVKCHVNKETREGVPELQMDAPVLDGIGARRHYDWMVRWILDPKSLRPTARMPKLVAGPAAQEEALAMAAYLASLKTGGGIPVADVPFQTLQNELKEGEGPAATGDAKPLYERLHCQGCHNPPAAKEPDPAKLSQKRIAEKFPPGRLAEFLRAPEAHYAWTRMPNFRLTVKEAKELEDWLLAAAEKPVLVAAPTDAVILEKGRTLVQTRGCLNCHQLKLENRFESKSLEALFARNLKGLAKETERDCLRGRPFADFQLAEPQRAALEAFLNGGRASLARHVPAEFAARQARQLNCTACHGQLDLVPPLEILGGKLKPEWTASFLAGEMAHKFRYDRHPKGEPWVDARMPAFKSRAQWLAPGFAEEHGHAPRTPVEPPVDPGRAEIGRKLVGKDGGFSCVSCHGVGSLLALEVFESEGINLVYSAGRLLPAYYRRWLRAPTTIDPQTKMPVYFDGGQSPLTDVLDGNAENQINAVWEYLRLGEKMSPPQTGTE